MGRLFWKFFFFILLAQVSAALGIGSILWLEGRSHIRNIQTIDDRPSAAFHIDAAAATLRFGGVDALRSLLSQQHHHQIYAVNQNGELLGRSVSAATLTQARALLQRPESVVQEVLSANGERYLLFQVPSALNADSSANADADRPPPGPPPPFERHRPPNELAFPLLPLGVATLASLLFALLLAWYFSKPIRYLKQAFDAAADGNLDRRLGPIMGLRRDELSDLGRDFDHMTDKLRALMDGQRRLLHDVSHELRSPLTRLQASIGLAVQQPEKMAESLQRIAREGARIDKLVSELLTLSKLEAGVMQTRVETIELHELLHDVVDDAQFEADATHCSVVLEGNADCQVDGDPELLQRALENVIRNALKHSPSNSAITLRAVHDHNSVTLTVQDQGPGVPAAELTQIFTPFYRASNTNADGHGLGLAIAIRIIATHHGSIDASNRAQGGLCVRIVLPLSAAIE